MKTEELNYDLPVELIAQRPVRVRSESRLLVFNRSTGGLVDSRFSRIGDFLLPGDCLVLNDTKVLPARFFGRRSSGGKLEGLFLTESEPGVWMVRLRAGRRVRVGETIYLKDKEKADSCEAAVLDKLGDGKFLLKLDAEGEAETILERIGFPPLPPYIKRGDNTAEAAADRLRYQTVYARKAGAVAAPTAGLHFTEVLMERLREAGVCFPVITLHISLGTFKPVTAERLEEHKMEKERFSIDAENAGIVNAAREKGGRIVAVGTTSVRTLETVAVSGGRLQASSGQTALFIRPRYQFKLIDAMVTNFHLPKSTLLALVAAFAGLEDILAAYQHAIEQRYRFYSYGDAMLIM